MRKTVGIYLLAILFPLLLWGFLSLESRSIYHPELAEFKNPALALKRLPIQNQVQDVYFKTRDGITLNAWYVPAKGDRPTVVFAHGNGGNIADRWGVMKSFISKGLGFLAFDYRGYGNSTGYPSEKGLYQDMEAASQYRSNAGFHFNSRLPWATHSALARSLNWQAVILTGQLSYTPSTHPFPMSPPTFAIPTS